VIYGSRNQKPITKARKDENTKKEFGKKDVSCFPVFGIKNKIRHNSTLRERLRFMDINKKIIELKDIKAKVAEIKESGKKIVFTNGCFDILHVGHVRYLAAARLKGDVLVVGLNSDESVKSIKSAKRPIVKQDERAEVLASMWCVDYIILFNEPDPLLLIQTINPDILVKGDDWAEENIIGADFVKNNEGRVVRIPVVPEASTSRIIERIIKRYR